MPYGRTTLDELGDGVFRKVRRALGVTAFGVNGIVLPPGSEWFNHFHEQQDELYFVHEGRAGFEIEGETFEVGPGGLVHVSRRRRGGSGTRAGAISSCWSSVARAATWSGTARWSTRPTSSGARPSRRAI